MSHLGKFILITVFLSLGFSSTSVAKETSTKLLELCKQEKNWKCPKATDDEQAHECAEKIGRLNKDFRKTACYLENEKLEKEGVFPEDNR